jgi:hypothetical protein
MAIPTPAAPSAVAPPYSIAALEGAGVSAIGAFATTFSVTHEITTSVVAAVGAALAFLGYHAYQSS